MDKTKARKRHPNLLTKITLPLHSRPNKKKAVLLYTFSIHSSLSTTVINKNKPRKIANIDS